MKKKITFLALLGAVVFSLAACQLFNYEEGGYSYRPIGSSGAGKMSDVSTPPAGDLEAIESGRTYGDYIKNNVYNFSSTPTVGKAKLLVIPVWFNDSGNFIDQDKKGNVLADIQTVYFGKNTEVGWRSVKTYYEEESHGKLKIDGNVSSWYLPNQSYQNYKLDNDHAKTTALVNSAINWYFDEDNPSDSRASYDCDKDGYLDGVMLIYAAPDFDVYGDQNSSGNLWAYCYWVQDPSVKNTVKPGVNAFFWASYDFMYGKNKAGTRTGHDKYANGDTSNNVNVDAHTYVHEMGHMFGLEDYYDYSDYHFLPAGGFSMQDNNVGGHDPFSVFSLGWGKAYIPTTTMNIDLKPFTQSGEMIILSPNWDDTINSPFDEYLILEYYTNDGLNYFDSEHAYMEGVKVYPQGSQDYGIRLWHVDARLLYTSVPKSYSAARVTNDPKIGGGNRVTMLMSNTYNDGQVYEDYLSPLSVRDPNEDRYSRYNILELIRNSTVISSPTSSNKYFTSSSLFKAGDTFTMSRYTRQFTNTGSKLNNGSSLGFTFTVNALNNGYASITVNKI